MKPIIRIENLSKQYRLGTIGTGTLSNDLKRWSYRIRGKEDPFLKVGDTNNRASKGQSNYVWALKDINFEVNPGEVVGIIGRNGAGKSTLLKILSKVTGPSTGRIDYDGRIGSLLEVGTGFHPELTGRDNIFLNGAILGMTKKEIRSKLDEIIDFSGCERYIDTPVKRYSSGMTVRLGFAVAAHLEPEILVVDEVLAVGDAEFQRKAIGKMQDVSRNEGRTVLFVSHNMASIQALCTKGILLRNGEVALHSDISSVINEYVSCNTDIDFRTSYVNTEKLQGEGIGIKQVYYLADGVQVDNIMSGQDVDIVIHYESSSSSGYMNTLVGIYNNLDEKLIILNSDYDNKKVPCKREGKITCRLKNIQLVEGQYSLNIQLSNATSVKHIKGVINLMVEKGDFYGNGLIPTINECKFLVNQEWYS
ncbi:ABC transporter ATP-binding protein [Saccharicrinis aurantiacus]|uniref:ABC transporter ATP-binding protein n=1 Tax=Saccharicrinis aurantiacus TaxID=1849719 RepID=UPI000839424D|nr:ABC transporter ATP-binding protein [Saccharicrinis aurantiacus]